jgi:hypothetical protein
MENQNFMVSQEISDQIDQEQFKQSTEEDDGHYEDLEYIVVHLESKDSLIPGIIQKYDYRIVGVGEEISFTFLTAFSNVSQFMKKAAFFEKAKLMVGTTPIGEWDISGMEVKRITVEQPVGQTSCVITVVYK